MRMEIDNGRMGVDWVRIAVDSLRRKLKADLALPIYRLFGLGIPSLLMLDPAD